jgi:hypothetical protein
MAILYYVSLALAAYFAWYLLLVLLDRKEV